MKKKTVKIIVSTIIVFIVLFLICGLFVIFVSPYLFFATDKKKHSDWMKDLSGEKYISDFVLPGSHNSATNICDIPFFTKNQNLNIKDQLEIGVRTFDMRLKVNKGKAIFNHNGFNCKQHIFKDLDLNYVSSIMYDFLASYPSETILFLVKDESKNQDIDELIEVFKDTIKGNESYWLLTNNIPKLDEARGKIVLLTRFACDFAIDVKWVDQGIWQGLEKSYDLVDKGEYAICVQDRYEYKIGAKWNAFTSELPEFSKNTLVFNYLTTTEGNLSNPASIASKLNNKLRYYDIPDSFKGTIMLDYINSSLVERIINAN